MKISLPVSLYCQTPFQLANPTQLPLVGVGVDFIFPLEEEEGRKKEEITLTQLLAEGVTLHA